MLKKIKMVAACMALTSGVAHASTVTLVQGADWSEFRFDIVKDGGAWLEPNDNLAIITYDFSLDSSAALQVTDAHVSGDQFEVFSNGASLGLTSAPGSVGDALGDDYSAAFVDTNFSSGEWILGPGDYEITGFVRVQPDLYGRGAVRLVGLAAVPLPATLPLLLSAGAVLGFAANRRRRVIGRTAQ